MKLCLLHLDDALQSQPDFIAHCERNGAHHLEADKLGRYVRLWSKEEHLEALSALLCGQFAHLGAGPKLWFMGSGDFHHISALLIERTLAEQKEATTIIHFDNHPDWVHFSDGLHCGSWVNRAAKHPDVAKIITVGVSSKDLHLPEWKGANLALMRDGMLELYPFWHKPSRVRQEYGSGPGYTQTGQHLHWNTIAAMGEGPFLGMLMQRIQTHNVYLTIDKDVLRNEDAQTNWDQGAMRLPFLLDIISRIGQQHRIIGADVTGDYSAPYYDGSWFTRSKKRAEVWIDQPCQPDAQKAAVVNSASNHALLDVLQQVMA